MRPQRLSNHKIQLLPTHKNYICLQIFFTPLPRNQPVSVTICHTKAKETNVLRQQQNTNSNTFPIIATNYHKTILNILLRQTETPINQLKETLTTTTSKTRGEPIQTAEH